MFFCYYYLEYNFLSLERKGILMILSCSHVRKAFLTQEVLKDCTFHIEAHEKVAMVGVNGAGKTTLLRILIGETEPDDGQIYRQKDLQIGYLAQASDYTSTQRIEEVLLTVFADLIHMEEEMRRLEQEISHASTPELLEAYDRLQQEFTRRDGYQYRSRVRGVLKGLGFQEAEYELPVSQLSGGQRSRVALARLLLEQPDLLLLDEPTNHLDIAAIQWLEGFLTAYNGACLLISHDRYFLDKLCTRTIELERGVSSEYHGNYTFYAHEKELRARQALKEYNIQQAEIRRQQGIIADLRSRGMEKFIRRAQSREKILDKMEVLDKPTELNANMKLRLVPSTLSGEDVLSAEDLSKQFDGNLLFEHVNFQIRRGEKIALLGSNGTGKTTLFKMIMGLIPATSGYLRTGVKVYPGYYDQQQENLTPGNTVLEEIYDAFPQMTLGQVRNVLGAFLFRGDDVFKPIEALSGGEKARVSLCKIMLADNNFLLLDEPTNHLDIPSREVLEDNLTNYEGTILFISHDRYFINKVADQIYELTQNGIRIYPGGYDYYLEHASAPEQEVQAKSNSTTAELDFYQQKKLQRERTRRKTRFARVEKEIEEIEWKLHEIEEKMLDPEFYNSSTEFARLEQDQQTLNQQLEALMEEWSELADALEEEN